MNNLYFENVVHVGNLYLEHIFYAFESEPILFVCSDDARKLYLCLCAEIRYGQRWIAVESNLNLLKKLTNEKIDIASAFLGPREAIVIDMDLQGNEHSVQMNINKVDRFDLPEEGTFIRCDKEKAQNYLWKKELEIKLMYLRKIMRKGNIVNEVTSTYDASFYVPVNTLNKAVDVHTAFDNKMGGALTSKMIFKYEYSVSAKDRYAEAVDNLNVTTFVRDNYVQAA